MPVQAYLSRLGQIRDLLLQANVTTADNIAAQTNVSVRTVYRDVQRLRALGVRIDGAAGFGYMLREARHG